MLNITNQLNEFDPVQAERKSSLNTIPAGTDIAKLIRRAGDVREKMLHGFHHGKGRGESTRVNEVDQHLRWKRGFLYAFTGWPQMGKSEMVNFLAVLKAKTDGWKWVMFPPESLPAEEMYDQLAHTLTGQSTDPIYKNQMSEKDYLTAIDFLHEHFLIVDEDLLEQYHVPPTPENVRELIRFAHAEYNIDAAVKDPWNTLLHDGSIRDDKYLEEQLRQEKRLAVKLNIPNIILVHPRSWNGQIPEGGLPMPEPHHIANGAMWNNKCDVIGAVHRPNYFSDRTDGHAELATHKVKKQALIGCKPGKVEMYFRPTENRYYFNNRCPLITDGKQPESLEQELHNWQHGANLPESDFLKPREDQPF